MIVPSTPPGTPSNGETAPSPACERPFALDQMLRHLIRDAQTLSGAACACVALVSEDMRSLSVAAATGSLHVGEGESLPVDGSPIGRVVLTGEAAILSALPYGALGRAGEERCGPVAVVPLEAGGVIHGGLLVARGSGAEAFGDTDVDELRHLARQAAAAIENTRLQAESAELFNRMQGRVNVLSALLETGNRLRLELDLSALLQQICDAIRDVLGWNYVAVALRDYAAGTSRIVAAAGLDVAKTQEILSSPPLPISRSAITDEEFRISNSYYIDHVALERFRSTNRVFDIDESREVAEGEWHPHDVLNVPIVLRGEILGFILPDDPRNGRRPTLETVQTLELFANQAAVAIDNARLYQEQRTRSEELERAYAELRASQERLLVSEKMAALGRVTAGIAHEINSPLGGVLNSLEMARSYAEEYERSADDPEVTPADHRAIAVDLKDTLELAYGASRKVAQFVRSIKNQTRSWREDENRDFDPAEEIEQSLVLLRHELRDRSVRLHTEAERGRVHLSGDPTKFSLVLQNLLSNAIDACGDAGGDVWVRLHDREGAVELQVEDSGCGISEEIRGRIFDYLFTTKEVGKGTGLGLAIVHSVVTSHFGGSIDLRSAPGKGALFCVTLPSVAFPGGGGDDTPL